MTDKHLFYQLQDDLIRDEGLELKPYRCPAGKLTIGVGRNLEDLGITKDEALHMLHNDLTRIETEARKAFGFYDGLPEPHKRGLLNMLYNLGLTRLKLFKNMLAALSAGNGEQAADEALCSKWALQVGVRADRIAALFRRKA